MARPRTVEAEFREEYCDQLIEHMAKGYSYESFAAKLDTYRQKLYEWEKQFPEFSDSKKIAMEKAQLWWEQKVVEGVFQDNEPSALKLNTAMVIFAMKAKFRWSDRDPIPEQQIEEREVVTLEDKKKLLIQAKEEIKKLEAEVDKESGKGIERDGREEDADANN